MAGLFDDLTAAPAPAKPATASRRPGLFDDLLEAPAASAAHPMTLADGTVPPELGAKPKGQDIGTAGAALRATLDGIPVAGPGIVSGVERAAAGVGALRDGTPFSDALDQVQANTAETAKAHPYVTTAGEIVGGIAGTAPLVMAAPAAFGAGAAALPVRIAAATGSGIAMGAADSAVRSGGDTTATTIGGVIGGGLGAAGPVVGNLVGKGVRAFTSRGRSNALVQEALEGVSDKDLASAQFLIEQAKSLPGGGVNLSLDEALNAVTGGQATRASQLARVVGNSGGEGSRIMGEFYAGRPAAVDNVGKAAFDRVAKPNLSPTAAGFDLQDAARAGVAQTPEGQALAGARRAQSERISPEQAGQAIQSDLARARDQHEATRTAQANVDYRRAREAPENVGIERTVTVERPGEPIVTQPEGKPSFTEAAPRPLEAFAPPDVEAAGPRGESLARFIARNGGLGLSDDVRATDLHRFGVPGVGLVAHEGGKSLDGFWRTKLMEAGYFRPDTDGMMQRDISSELLRKLHNEQRGVPSYPLDTAGAAGATKGPRAARWQAKDEYDGALSTAEHRLGEDLTRAGVPPESLHPDVRSRVLGAMMRGEHPEPLDAYEAVIGGMKEPPRPYVKSTSVTEEIPDVRFGQVDPRPAVEAVAEQGRTAKGDVRGALGSTGRDLREPGGELDMSVAGLLHARERLDTRISRAQELGDNTKVRDLTITRNALDEQLKRVPEVETADANFARNSAPLEPFERANAPLNRITARAQQPGREPGPFRTPAEQVPEALTGPTALREALANGGEATREAAERRLSTRILDGATGTDGSVSAEALRTAMREHADVLELLPALRNRLSTLVVAREGLARVEASPLGRITQRPDVKAAITALFPQNPLSNSHAEIGAAVQALGRNNPRAARDVVRIYMEGVFNEATQELKGVARQYGGAGFASAVRGNGQQRHNLEAAIRALPEGETLWTGLDRMMTTLEATGYRPQKGSDTAFNQAIQARLKQGAGPVGQAIAEVVSGAAAGATVGGPKGALGGAVVGARRGGAALAQERRVQRDGEAIARILTDPKAIPLLRSLAQQPEGGRGAEILTTKLLLLGQRGASSAVQAPASPPAR